MNSPCSRVVLPVVFLVSVAAVRAQETPQKAESKEYTRSEAMVPMRDGVKLHVVILRPVGSESAGEPLPFLMERTPYGTDNNSSKMVNGSKAGAGGERIHLCVCGYSRAI